jgi:hypothetical protein
VAGWRLATAAVLCLALAAAASPAHARRCLACHAAGHEAALESLAGGSPWHPAETFACPGRAAARREVFVTASRLERLSALAAEAGQSGLGAELARLERAFHQALERPVRSVGEIPRRLGGLRERLHERVQAPLWGLREARAWWRAVGWVGLGAAGLALVWLAGRLRRRGPRPLSLVLRGKLWP